MMIDKKFGYKEQKQCFGVCVTKIWIPVNTHFGSVPYSEVRRTRVCQFHADILRGMKQGKIKMLNSMNIADIFRSHAKPIENPAVSR